MVTVVWPWSNRTRSFVPACQLQELGRVMKDDSFFYLFWDCNMIVDKSALYSLEKRYLYHGEYRDVFQMYVTLTKIRVAIIDQMLLLSTSVVLVILFLSNKTASALLLLASLNKEAQIIKIPEAFVRWCSFA